MVAARDSAGPAGGRIGARNHTDQMLVFDAYLYVFSAYQQVAGKKYRQIHADTYRYALLVGVHICMYSVQIRNYSG